MPKGELYASEKDVREAIKEKAGSIETIASSQGEDDDGVCRGKLRELIAKLGDAGILTVTEPE